MNELVKNKKKWELLVEAVSQMEYGSVILHTDISQMLGERYGTTKYNSLVQRAKKELLTLSKDIECVRGQGYRVLNPDDYTDKAVGAFKMGFNKLQHGSDLLTHAPVSHMSGEARKAHRDVSDRARVLCAAMAGGCTELKMLAKKPCALSVENVSRG